MRRAPNKIYTVDSSETLLLAKDPQPYAITEAASRSNVNSKSQSNLYYYDGILFKV
jgi:hypothetical protein